MKKYVILLAMLPTLLLSGCVKDRHYFVTIINNSDYTIAVTSSRAGSTLIGSLKPDVSLSYVIHPNTNGSSIPIDPHSKRVLDMSPTYFEKFTGTQPTAERDRLRFYIIDKPVLDAVGGRPRELDPEDYLGYIDLSSSEAAAINWTFRFPDDTINNMQEETTNY